MDELIRTIRTFALFGTVICLLTFLLSSFGGDTEEIIPVSTETECDGVNDGDSEASVDPFGYFNGKWNLWEYIGDSVSSLIQ